jgi:hypothetical protein
MILKNDFRFYPKSFEKFNCNIWNRLFQIKGFWINLRLKKIDKINENFYLINIEYGLFKYDFYNFYYRDFL